MKSNSGMWGLSWASFGLFEASEYKIMIGLRATLLRKHLGTATLNATYSMYLVI